MKRKDFLKKSAMAAFAVSTFGVVKASGAKGFKGDCETTNDILGPFYKPNAPLKEDLTFPGLKGVNVRLKGKVYGSDCETQLKNALVEIWHCDTEGAYDNVHFKHRGRRKTNEKGEYAFQTILPGKYLNGRLYRPAHIHFRVTAPGHKELVSQIYFEGDPHINEDPWASKDEAEHRILPIALEDTNGSLAVTFDIYLRKK